MEASAVHAPAAVGRLSLAGPLLRLRSDEQLVALFRAGSEEAFAVIHERFRQRLFAYIRQMLSGASRQDAEDVLQDVFMRAYSALRNDTRDINLKAWLYRVAHNRCIDHVRRPTPPAADVVEMSRGPLVDPMETAQRRDDLRRLVGDVGRLPEQQRSALLMREIDGLAYADIADALGVTVPAVKSLLVRARVGLAEAAEARETDCAVIRADLAASYDKGVKASARARRHMRECSPCAEFKTSLRGMRRQFAALSPVGVAGPIALVAKLIGVGGAGAGGGAAATAGGGAAVVGTATACKVAAVVCTAAIATGGAVEVRKHVKRAPATTQSSSAKPAPETAAPAVAAVSAPAPAYGAPTIRHRTEPAVAPAPKAKEKAAEPTPAQAPIPANGVKVDPAAPVSDPAGATGGAAAPEATGPVTAPLEKPAGSTTPPAEETGSGTSAPSGSGSGAEAPTQEPPATTGQSPTGSGGAPPAEH